MNYPNFSEEKKLWQKGYECVVGLDEAGRGPLAGPVVAAAITVQQNTNHKFQITNVNDSKRLSEKRREEFYEVLTKHPDIVWGVGIVSEKEIDRINILQATKLAMQKALENLYSKYTSLHKKSIGDFLLIDGNFAIKTEIPQRSIIKGDAKVFSIAAASIIAKVTRDRIMRQAHEQYPVYGFDKHKGYGTAAHIASLKKFGASDIHRRSFYPVSAMVQLTK
ncbi:MAG TPA: ribonuclease HII [Negativicutes bacterium]|nr:ribonuclease HII [Negativicutes bacterium]